MLRMLVLSIVALFAGDALASANASVSEKQTLLGLSTDSYYVISIESEAKISHTENYQRVMLKQYDLDSNVLISEVALSETQVSTNSESLTQSIKIFRNAEDSLNRLLSKSVVNYSGFSVTPIKKFVFDKNGLYLMSGGVRDYVLSREEILQRMPTYDQRMKYNFTMPKVVAVHSEPTSSKVRYLIVIRSGRWRSDTSSFEYVVSLPEE